MLLEVIVLTPREARSARIALAGYILELEEREDDVAVDIEEAKSALFALRNNERQVKIPL